MRRQENGRETRWSQAGTRAATTATAIARSEGHPSCDRRSHARASWRLSNWTGSPAREDRPAGAGGCRAHFVRFGCPGTNAGCDIPGGAAEVAVGERGRGLCFRVGEGPGHRRRQAPRGSTHAEDVWTNRKMQSKHAKRRPRPDKRRMRHRPPRCNHPLHLPRPPPPPLPSTRRPAPPLPSVKPQRPHPQRA